MFFHQVRRTIPRPCQNKTPCRLRATSPTFAHTRLLVYPLPVFFPLPRRNTVLGQHIQQSYCDITRRLRAIDLGQ